MSNITRNKLICLLAGVLTLACGAAPTMSLRLRRPHTETDAQWQKTYRAIAGNPGCCDEVWFSTGSAVPPLAWHAAQARRLVKAAEDLRKLGIVPSLQVQATLGHSDKYSAMEDCSGKTWTGWTGSTGKEDKYCNCPRQPAFLAYLREMSRGYAAFKPDWVWIDDDLRTVNHSPASDGSLPGCWCATCLKAFSDETGKAWTRPALAAAVAKDSALRARWQKFSYESLALVARAIAEEFHKLSPETRMGLQCISSRDYAASVAVIREALATASGHPVGLRPGGGFYYDFNPNDQIVKSMNSARARTWLASPDVDVWCTETETTPRAYGSRSAQSVLVESFVALSYGCTATSWLIMDTRTEEDALYSRTLLKPLAEAAPVLKGYVRANEGTEPVGYAAEKTPTAQLYNWALCGIPVLPGPGQALGTLTGADLKLNVTRTRSVQIQDARTAHPAPVTLESPFVGLMIPRASPVGAVRTVALLNARIDAQGPVTLRLAGSFPAKAVWHELRRPAVTLPVTVEKGVARVTIPAIGAWNAGYLAFGEKGDRVGATPTAESDHARASTVAPRSVPGRTPTMAFRLRRPHTETDAKWQKTYQMIAANPGCCDEVWFQTGVAVPPLAWHREHAQRIARAAAEMRQLGIVASVYIGGSIGHSDAFSATEDCSGKNWTGWTGSKGVEDKNCNCPRQPAFIDYLREVARLYAACKPYRFWFDDDFRIVGHAPATDGSLPGCWCATCLKAFSDETGKAWTRPALAAAVGKDPALRAKWRKFSDQSLANLARAVAEVVREVSPETHMGYQYCTGLQHSRESGFEPPARRIVGALAEASGHPVSMRPGGGAYYDLDPDKLVLKSMEAARSRKELESPNTDAWCPEVESSPRAYGSRCGESVLVESFAALAYGCTFTSMLITDPRIEDEAVYSRTLLKPLAEGSSVLKGYVDANAGTVPVGYTAAKTPTAQLYNFALSGVPVLPGIGQSLGTLTGADLKLNVARTRSSDVQAAREAHAAPATLESPFVGLMVPRVTAAGAVRTVALLNTRIDAQGPVTLRLTGSVPAKAVWHELRRPDVTLPVTGDKGVVRVTIPAIGAWSAGYLEFKD